MGQPPSASPDGSRPQSWTSLQRLTGQHSGDCVHQGSAGRSPAANPRVEPDLIPSEVDCYEHFGVSRSFRRGTTSSAHARGVDKDIVDLTNRWRQFEHAKGKHPRMSMQDHYSDIWILVPELIKFSQAV